MRSLTALVLLIPLFLLPGTPAWAGTPSPQHLTEALAQRLGEEVREVGPVQRTPTGIHLERSGLSLEVVTYPMDDGLGHMHVLARLDGSDQIPLNACVVDQGVDEAQLTASLVNSYVYVALPSILSQVEGRSRLGGRRFGGSEPYAAPGRRGFVGAWKSLGDVTLQALELARSWESLPDLPDDQALHLLKVTIFCEEGACTRTVELDGAEEPCFHGPVTGLVPPAGPAMAVQYAVMGGPDTLLDESARAGALEELSTDPQWLRPATSCPADAAPELFEVVSHGGGACSGGRLATCLRECEGGATDSCFNAALDLEAAGLLPGPTQALFTRACVLGMASGCTNAAAGRTPQGGLDDECSLRTFGLACEVSGDPWGCTMLGASLLQRGVEPDRARVALTRACAGDPLDPACEAAKGVLRSMKE